jgi:hypothetical protein
MSRRIGLPKPSYSSEGIPRRTSGIIDSMGFHSSWRSGGIKVLTGLAVAGGFLIAGCSSEVGSNPSSKDQMRAALSSELEKASQPQQKGRGKGRPSPKSIKTKLLDVKDEGN